MPGFCQVELSPEGVETTWGRLMDETHPVSGVAAVDGGTLVGIAHFRSMPNPLRGREVGFLDDLFVRHEGRGEGIAVRLIQHVKDHASANGWKIVRWLTRDNNYRARGVYDRVADRSDWITYEMHVSCSAGGKPDQLSFGSAFNVAGLIWISLLPFAGWHAPTS